MILLKKQDSCLWQCSRNGCLCSTDLQMHDEENPHYYISGVYHDVSVGFINFLEALPKECKRKTMVLYKKLCSSQASFWDTILPLSCRKVLPPVPSGPRSACRCNWWRPSLCSYSQPQGGCLLPLGKKYMWEPVHCLHAKDSSELKAWHSEAHQCLLGLKLFFTANFIACYILWTYFIACCIHIFHKYLKFYFPISVISGDLTFNLINNRKRTDLFDLPTQLNSINMAVCIHFPFDKASLLPSISTGKYFQRTWRTKVPLHALYPDL